MIGQWGVHHGLLAGPLPARPGDGHRHHWRVFPHALLLQLCDLCGLARWKVPSIPPRVGEWEYSASLPWLPEEIAARMVARKG